MKNFFQGSGKVILASALFFSFGAHALAASPELLERPLLKMRSAPAQPKVGERISIFAALDTSFQNRELLLEGFIGDVPVRFDHSGSELFIANLNAYSEVKPEVSLRVDLYLRDTKKSLRYRQAINGIRTEIKDLDAEIAGEADPVRRAELEALRAKKAEVQSQLETALDNLKEFLKSENFQFAVEKDPANTAFPLISGVAPNAVLTGRRTKLTLTGERFGASPQVKIGGLNSTLISSTATEIVVLGPNFADAGPKEIEVKFPPDGATPRKNAFLSNSFFATQVGLLKNLRPVAVATGYVRAVWPVISPVTLTGTNSYDENGDALAYSWEVLAAPAGSIYPAGTLLDPVATPSFTPDKLGIFRIRFRVQETATDNEYLSFPVIVTVEVK